MPHDAPSLDLATLPTIDRDAAAEMILERCRRIGAAALELRRADRPRGLRNALQAHRISDAVKSAADLARLLEPLERLAWALAHVEGDPERYSADLGGSAAATRRVADLAMVAESLIPGATTPPAARTT